MKAFGVILGTLSISSVVLATNFAPVQTVFVILLENHNWADIKGSPSAPYVNLTLLPQASYCEQYFSPAGKHPSLPNYLWLEAGTNFSITDDNPPAYNHESTTNHLVSLLLNAGISWRAYQEDIMPGYVPLEDTNNYAVRHNPFVFFDDVTGTNNPDYAYGSSHIRPFVELAADLTNNTVARYNFITPNLYNDGHTAAQPDYDTIKQTDDWLSTEVPKIVGTAAYSNNGALFIIWDEGENSSDGPIGMIVLSPLAWGGGYNNSIPYTHSSLLRTLQEIFGVTPWLGDAANATDLSDLFAKLTIKTTGWSEAGGVNLTVTGVLPGQTNYIQASTNLVTWQTISTNWNATNSFTISDDDSTNFNLRFYRAAEVQ